LSQAEALLGETLEEEKAADMKLSQVADEASAEPAEAPSRRKSRAQAA
jgi:ferritin-like metal-binding protein YciE